MRSIRFNPLFSREKHAKLYFPTCSNCPNYLYAIEERVYVVQSRSLRGSGSISQSGPGRGTKNKRRKKKDRKSPGRKGINLNAVLRRGRSEVVAP